LIELNLVKLPITKKYSVIISMLCNQLSLLLNPNPQCPWLVMMNECCWNSLDRGGSSHVPHTDSIATSCSYDGVVSGLCNGSVSQLQE
jgi:hypothetical protein